MSVWTLTRSPPHKAPPLRAAERVIAQREKLDRQEEGR
jgi:hypothetical protein